MARTKKLATREEMADVLEYIAAELRTHPPRPVTCVAVAVNGWEHGFPEGAFLRAWAADREAMVLLRGASCMLMPDLVEFSRDGEGDE